MDEFSGSLRNVVDGPAVLNGWLEVVSETMHPTTAAVWVRDGA